MDGSATRGLSRRQMLKDTALAFGGVAGSVILAACGGGAPPAVPPAAKSSDAPTPATAPKPAADAPKPATDAAAPKPAAGGQRVVVRDHDWLQGTPGQPNDWYDAFIAKFEEEHPDIKVEREWIPRGEMHAKLMALAATGQSGDTIRINVAPVVSELQLKGVVRDLNSRYANDQQWTNNDLKQFWPGNLKTYTRDGKLWGLPVVGHPGAVHYYVNKTMVEKPASKCRRPTATGATRT